MGYGVSIMSEAMSYRLTGAAKSVSKPLNNENDGKDINEFIVETSKTYVDYSYCGN